MNGDTHRDAVLLAVIQIPKRDHVHEFIKSYT
jgi:hypothetical protein